MKFFLDTEFSERGPGHPIELISLALVSEMGVELYRVSSEFRPENCNSWVRENVLPNLAGQSRHSLRDIRDAIRVFIEQWSKELTPTAIRPTPPEFWGYYADYDWVVFCQIFGTMIDLPEGWPMYCRDLKQWADELGNPPLPKQESTEHNALNDARWNREVHKFLRRLSSKLPPTRTQGHPRVIPTTTVLRGAT